MAKRNVVWTRTADVQLVGVLQYWLRRNKSNTYSKKLLRLVTKRTELLARNPLTGKPSDFKDIRVAALSNFSLFYKVTESQIIISAFWDNRQDPKKLLNLLKS